MKSKNMRCGRDLGVQILVFFVLFRVPEYTVHVYRGSSVFLFQGIHNVFFVSQAGISVHVYSYFQVCIPGTPCTCVCGWNLYEILVLSSRAAWVHVYPGPGIVVWAS